MNTPDQNDVSAALALLGETLTEEEKRIRTEGSQAMQRGDFATATAVIEFAKRLLAFSQRVGSLAQEWHELETLRDQSTPLVQEIVSKHFFGRRHSSEITPKDDYYRPILEALAAMGGSGRTQVVLDRVGEMMKTILKPKDYEALPSLNGQIRWRNKAQWARNHMVNDPTDGRMKKGSPNGHWEISAAGRAWLKTQTSRPAARHP